MERRLSAVLAFDMVGYSRLIGVDEQGTLAAFRRHRNAIFSPRAAQYHGRIVKFTGDGALIEFSSVVDSVCFAVEVQVDLGRENSGVSEDRQFRYRVGVNIGDIVLDEGDIYGDGVNVAARLQVLADPGGICVSGTAFEQVRGKLDLTFEHLGEKQVKNIVEAVTVYRVRLDEKALALVTPIVRKTTTAHGGRGKLAATATALLLGLMGATLWLWQPWTHLSPRTTVERFAYPLPDKPSIAVLPFINTSKDAEQDHLAEGLTDGLITELSKVSGVFVIARHSVFALENKVGNIQKVAAELGVHFVLEGTLQRAESRLRINVNLIDALTGLSLWAERYDREYSDIFAVQDDVIGKIISALAVKLSEGERYQLARIPTDSLEAYDYYLRAEQEGFFYSDVATYRRTLSFYQKAIDLDPDFADAHAGIARVAVDVWRNDYNLIWSAAVARKIAYDAAGQALKLEPNNARAHTVLALLQLVDGREAEAIDSANKAVTVQPNDSEAVGNLALVLAHTGSRERAVTEMERALRLDPAPRASFKLLAGVVLYAARENERAIPLLEAARDGLPSAEPAREYLAAAYAHRGDRQRAEQEAKKLLELFPDSNLTYYSYLYAYWREDDRRYHLTGLREAGIPDWPFGFQGRETDLLSAAELSELIRDKTWTGRHKNGTDFVQYFDKAGNTAYRSANTNVTGVIKVQENQLCEKFDGYFLDRMWCGYIYRNTTKAEPHAEYIHVTPQALKFFSLDGR
jgi:adenylate cyclase